MADVSVHQGDLTAWVVDAIVNAANNDLILGSGLAGAIARRGGPSIQAECQAHGSIEVGQAAITGAGDLPAKFIIHQASMGVGKRVTEQSLRSSTVAAFQLAEDNGLASIAFPATGTGVGGFDMRRCAEIMIGEAQRFLAAAENVRDVLFVLFDEDAREVFQQVADATFA